MKHYQEFCNRSPILSSNVLFAKPENPDFCVLAWHLCWHWNMSPSLESNCLSGLCRIWRWSNSLDSRHISMHTTLPATDQFQQRHLTAFLKNITGDILLKQHSTSCLCQPILQNSVELDSVIMLSFNLILLMSQFIGPIYIFLNCH